MTPAPPPAVTASPPARAPQRTIHLRGSIAPTARGATSAGACPDTMRAVASTTVLAPFGAQPSQPIVVVSADAFGSGEFGTRVQNATARAQLARACNR